MYYKKEILTKNGQCSEIKYTKMNFKIEIEVLIN